MTSTKKEASGVKLVTVADTTSEADTRATRQGIQGPATRTETTEPILPKSTWRHDRGLQIHTQHPQNRAGATTTRD